MPLRLASIAALLLCAASPLWAASIRVTRTARAIQPGELVVLTLAMPDNAEDVRVRAFGRELPPFRVDDRKWRVLVGIDVATEPGAHPVTIEARLAARTIHSRYVLKVRPRRFATRTLTVDAAFVDPPAEALARIAQETTELQQLWKDTAAERLWNGPFERPVPGRATGAFGTRSIFNGQPRSQHSGADLLSPTGTLVHAPNRGRVVLARDLYFTGNTVLLDHGLGLFSMLAHLSVVDVSEGSMVSAGDVVGEVGATGRVTGPHLHWAIRVGDSRVDPLSVLATLGAPAR